MNIPFERKFVLNQTVLLSFAALGMLALSTAQTFAHPHVFIEANLEIVRNEKGEATAIRHVWRFDEIFSSSAILDFDADGNGQLDQSELDTIAKNTKLSLADYNYYTEIRNGDKVINFYEPDPYLVSYENGQMVIIMSLEIEKPELVGPEGFKVAVSDATYYVAVEMTGNENVQISGKSAGCTWEIMRPDFDELYKTDAKKLADLFAAGPDEKVEADDAYLTWVNFSCK